MTDTPRGYPVPAPTDVVSLDAVQDLADAIDTDVTAVAAAAGSALASHEADTTSVHGIADTALLVRTSDTGTVATAMIADSAVTSAKIADATIVTGDLADSAVTSAKIADGAVVTADLADSAVTSAKIADGTIVNADVNASAAIAATKVAGTAVTQADTGTVTNTMLAGSIAAAKVTGTAVVTGDSRLSDARTPTAHAASHGTGQSDAITIAPAQVTGTAVVNTLVDAKGDLVAASAADTPARLAVGVAGTNPILTPDTSAASGLAWKSHADADVAQASTVGNLLTSNQASVETDTAGFVGYTNVADLDVSTEHARHGTHSLKVTSAGSDDTRVQLSEGLYTYTVPLVPLLPHTFLVYVKSEATSRTVSATVIWRDSAGDGTGSPTSVTSAAVTSSTSDWTLIQVTGVAPATAANAQPVVTFAGSVAAEVHYIDCLSFHVGAGGEWQMPGVPTPDLGIRANPADATQVQIWNPGNATWITV